MPKVISALPDLTGLRTTLLALPESAIDTATLSPSLMPSFRRICTGNVIGLFWSLW